MYIVAPIAGLIAASTIIMCPPTDQKADTAAVAMAAFADAKADIIDTAVAAGSFKTLAAAIKAAGLIETLKGEGPFTVFAPTDEAFAALPPGTVENLLKPENKGLLTAVLTYHVVKGDNRAGSVVKMSSATTINGQRIDVAVKGDKVMVDKANVVKTDIVCTNGVIHVIDRVLMPAGQDLLETAAAAGSFTTLAAAIEAAGLVSTLQGEGPFTVFAPTDEAFAKLPKESLADLLKPENRKKLVAVLTYHVVPGRVYSDQVVKLSEATTVQGSKVKVMAKDGKVMIDKASVLKADIEASNGVIHVIDSVLMPAM